MVSNNLRLRAFEEMARLLNGDKIFIDRVRKKPDDAIDVEFRVIEEVKQIGNGSE